MDNKNGLIDLHCHTTASDGTFTPEELIKTAAAIHLKAIAITDHDVMDGIAPAMKATEEYNIKVVPAVEISVEYKGPKVEGRSGWMHLLVYYLKDDGPLGEKLKEIQLWRKQRNYKILEKLANLNMPISMDELKSIAKGQIGRPHFAKIMLDKGYVQNMQEAFDKYLAKGALAYVDKKRLTPTEAIQMAVAENAIPVLAHPFSLGLDNWHLMEMLKIWTTSGLKGIEVIYPQHSSKYRKELSEMAELLHLKQTGGSDFHGDNKANVKLGTGIDNNVKVESSVLDELEQLL